MIQTSQPTGRLRSALTGIVSAGLGFGVSELASGLLGIPSLIQGVADWVVDSVPPGVKDWAITVFGTNDKLALVVGIVAVGLGLGGLAGVLAGRRFGAAVAIFAGFGAAGALASSSNPATGVTAAWLVAIAAVVAGLAVLNWLTRAKADRAEMATRRDFLKTAAVAGLGIMTAGMGRALYSSARAAAGQREEVAVPQAIASELPAGTSFDVSGLTPVVVPNKDFYRIDTAIAIPRVDLDTWSLTFTGMVDTPYQIGFDELMDLPLVERYVTLSCVSNPVGGDLVGNARWLGVPLRDLLERAGVKPDAEQLVARSVDDFTVGFPVEAAFDGREALVAVGMNGEALPIEHGFPVRLVVSGLYGYVSATKWLTEIELTTWDGFDAYWVPRGWSKEAPVKTQSRIDTPARGSIESGTRFIAGVAWAPHRGIDRVEVQLDNGSWMEAELSEPLSKDAWRQWRLSHDFTTGSHRIRVRATDGTGQTQSENERPPAPNGAEGWHTVVVTAK